jgi:hypothetical protein
MTPATKEHPPVAQKDNVKKTVGSPDAPSKQDQHKPDWIEHRDWHGEGVVGERHTD